MRGARVATGSGRVPRQGPDRRPQAADPFGSSMWPWIRTFLLGDPAELGFDDRVRVSVPAAAIPGEPLAIGVDATALGGVTRLLIIADHARPPLALQVWTGLALPRLGLRLGFGPAGPLRAAAETPEGWRVGGVMVEATPGCGDPVEPPPAGPEATVPLRVRVWPDTGRLRLMLAGSPPGPAPAANPYAIRADLTLSTEPGDLITRLQVFAPLGPAPSLTFDLPPALCTAPILLGGRDMAGQPVSARVAAAPSP